MRMLKQLSFALLVSFFVFSGCSKDSNPVDVVNGDFAVKVSSGTTPEYSWDAGKAFSLSVVRTDNPTVIVWGVATPGQDNIASPLKHGAVPAGVIPTFQAEKALTKSVTYRVSVTLLSGKTGWTEFTP